MPISHVDGHPPRGDVQLTPGVKARLSCAAYRNKLDQRAEIVARLLLGSGAPTERLSATSRTKGRNRFPCNRRSVNADAV